MNKQVLISLLLGFSLALNLLLGVWGLGLCLTTGPTPQLAYGGANDNTHGGWIALTGKLSGKGDGEGLYLIDTEGKKMYIYFVQGKMLELSHVRDISKDMEIPSYGDQTEVKKEKK